VKKQSSTWFRIAPYLLGAILFFIGATRFLLREDTVGAVTLSIAGFLALYMVYLNLSRRDPGAN